MTFAVSDENADRTRVNPMTVLDPWKVLRRGFVVDVLRTQGTGVHHSFPANIIGYLKAEILPIGIHHYVQATAFSLAKPECERVGCVRPVRFAFHAVPGNAVSPKSRAPQLRMMLTEG